MWPWESRCRIYPGKHDDDGEQMRLLVNSTPKPKQVRLWVPHSDDKDFRPDRWEATQVDLDENGAYIAHIKKPEVGHVAFFAEATYQFGSLEYSPLRCGKSDEQHSSASLRS